MKIYKAKEVSVIREILVGISCDICNKDISHKEYYYKVTTGHYDWGNDSHESIEDKDICSDGCLQKEFLKYLEEKTNSGYIEIQRERARIK